LDEPIETNRQAWDEHAAIHVMGNTSYPLEAFRAGKAGLSPNTPDSLGDVRGKRLLHLQCHFGLDSLMWARQGAIVTGVDFSKVAIAEARKLAVEVAVNATFIEADVLNLPDAFTEQFDVALSYYGVIPWLGNLGEWADGIARCLKPGGFFYLADCHPIATAIEVPQGESVPRLQDAYFGDGRPMRCEGSGTYAAPEAKTQHNITYQWQHALQDVLGALLDAQLRLVHFHEFPYSFYEKYSRPDQKLMYQDEGGWWHLLHGDGLVPLMFSIKFSKK
jgi:SAM-dependent methyltransferase